MSIAACAQLLDRLAASDQAPFIAQWIESVLSGRNRTDPTLAVRLLRCYRETGRIDRARELAASLPSAPASWTPLDAARLAIERAILATIDGRADHAEAELRVAARALGSAPEGRRPPRAARHAPHAGPARDQARSLARRGARPSPRRARGRAARRRGVARAGRDDARASLDAPVGPAVGRAALRDRALAHPGPRRSVDDARTATSPSRSAASGASTRAATTARRRSASRRSSRPDGGTPTRTTSSPSSRSRPTGPLAALQAIDEALVVLGEIDHTMLRYQLAVHRTWALAMLGRAQAAQAVAGPAEKLRGELPVVDAIDEQDLASTRARTLEACGQPREAIDEALAARPAPAGGVRHRLAEPGRRPLRPRDRRRTRRAARRRARRALGRSARLGLPRPRGVPSALAARAQERRQPRGALRRANAGARQRHERRDSAGAAAAVAQRPERA